LEVRDTGLLLKGFVENVAFRERRLWHVIISPAIYIRVKKTKRGVSELKSFNLILKRELHVNCVDISKRFITICIVAFILKL